MSAVALAACGDGEGDDALGEATADDPIEITMYYPIAVGGPLEEVVDGLVEDFEEENPEIAVEAVYSGDYDETLVAVQSAIDAGDAPVTSVLRGTEMFDFIEDELIVPFDEVVDDDEWLDSFYEAFLADSRDGEGRTWGIPFQRSTVVQYWNKEAFDDAGLDPEQPPETWDELVETSREVQEGSDVTWGVQIPSSGDSRWQFQSLPLQNGFQFFDDEDGTWVEFDAPEVVDALQFWVDLSEEHEVHPPGVIDWGTTPEDFYRGETAIIWTTTGQLASIRENADFDFGVSMLPANEERGSPTGGGNFYLFADAPEDEQQAAVELIRFLTQPEQAAEWSIETGYVAPTPEAWETDQMQEYVADFPQAEAARDQLEYASRELATYQLGQVYDAINDALQAALTGEADPESALQEAQERADAVLEPYR